MTQGLAHVVFVRVTVPTEQWINCTSIITTETYMMSQCSYSSTDQLLVTM